VDPKDQFPEHDRVMRDWFPARGWPVTESFADLDFAIYAWRHRGSQGCYTLYVSKEALDRNDARVLPSLLDQRTARPYYFVGPGSSSFATSNPPSTEERVEIHHW
jgi:hypothetical protein